MRVAVVGGGIAGLAAALRLVERLPAAEVTVLEASARPGGVLTTSRDGGWLREHAANAFLAGDPDGAVALCRELGVPLEEPSPAARHRWIWLGGRLHPLPTSPAALARSGLLSWRGKLALLAEPLRPARRLGPAERDDESVFALARRRVGPEAARAIVAPFVTGVFAGDARETSVVAGFPRLAALEDAGGLVRGMVRRAVAARRGGAARRERTRSLAPLDGVEALGRALAARLGPRVRTDAPVAAVAPRAGGVAVTLASGERLEVEAAVLATPAHRTAALVASVPEVAAAAAAIRYAPVAVVHLGVRTQDVAHPLDGFGALVVEGERPRVLGVVFESSVWRGRAPAGHALVRLIYGGTRDPGVVALDDAALLAQARADLGALVGLRADAAPVVAGVVRWSHGVAQYALGHAARVAAADAAAARARLVLAGSAWHGVAVTDCVADARRVAGAVAAWA